MPKTSDLYNDFVVHVSEQLEAFEVQDVESENIAKALRDHLRGVWGGANIYIPKNKTDNEGHKLLDGLEETAIVLLANNGFPDDRAKQIASHLKSFFYQHWLGQSIYIPFTDNTVMDERNAAIYDEYNGFNVRKLARKYGLSEQRVYRIIEAVRAEQKKQRHEQEKETP